MTTQTWTYDDLVKALRLRGYPLSRVSTELGLSYPATRYSIRHGGNEDVRRLVSEVLETPEWELWAERFPPQWRGNRAPPSS
jgi:lambda repressor-like predicted transcriptional regulator